MMLALTFKLYIIVLINSVKDTNLGQENNAIFFKIY